ncbi:lysozyme inhibitor LprI family protein [Kineosporia sp. NBRC 101731]|uniref:lysozyme inhibitor LprI family protein n=1 Tax=Kineosporia sp. NBRC 101731 TaxID=3032199 RepID=UPI0024A3050A|nr:lysozyme inhibitor LprI family protein [Kineosporia sp. NBRC 101731]GLY29982.1 hypothetical protein Kisp02_33470 [Kineosporia sp. NBRC 101731]
MSKVISSFVVAGVAATALVGGAVAASAQSGTQSSTAATVAARSGDGLKYKKLEEPFTTPVGPCAKDGTTVQMTNCVLKRIVATDHTVNVLQKQRFEYAITTKARKAYLRDDAAWLKIRAEKADAVREGGSLDSIRVAEKMLQISKKRVKALES